MTIGIEMLIGFVGLCIAVMTFLIGRQNAAKKDGATLAEIRTSLEYVRAEVKYIREKLEKQEDRYDSQFQRVYDRIAEHEKVYHAKG